jgi:hypothetical protein
VKRYRVDFSYGRYFFNERDDGDWISFEDSAAEIHRLNNQLTAAHLERDSLKRTMRLIEVQDQGCGGNLKPEEIYRAMQKLARETLS